MLPNKSLTQNDLAVWGRLGGIKNTPHEAGRGLKGVNRVSWAVFREDKMLKRHLSTVHGLGVNEYRERWKLPADYPMVAPNYAAVRSELAKKIGLGRKRRKR